MEKKVVNIVWFKRDLRFTDNEALFHAHHSGLPLLLIYVFEPSVMNYDDSDVRHWRFVYESLLDMQLKLNLVASKIYFFHNESKIIFSELIKIFNVQTIFSHQEIGNKITFDRDIEMQAFFNKNNPLGVII
ncbi:Deoxyribodipyrimidine photolyase PhrB2 (fragment) [Flavobacterium psychrophilum]|uniref:deoxyribodipyrimidine photo-lyase n=1 Tax=Flavobacterium psychrophilum TaxID=96345 RepID=UPI000B7C1ACC